MSIKNKQKEKKVRNISFYAIVETVHEIDNISLIVSDGTVIKAKVKPIKKEGDTVLLIPRMESTVLVRKGKGNGEYFIINAGKSYDEYKVVGINESNGECIVMAKNEISHKVVDLNLD